MQIHKKEAEPIKPEETELLEIIRDSENPEAVLWYMIGLFADYLNINAIKPAVTQKS